MYAADPSVRRERRLAYLRRHPPGPRTWTDAAIWVVDPSLEGDDEAVADRRAALLRELEQEGLVADDAAIVAWLARNDPPDAPWDDSDPCLSELLFGARALTFFVRWAIRQRAEGRLAAWFETVPLPTDAWQPFCDALLIGSAPNKLPRNPEQQLQILLAATGDPPPPWARGEPPEAIEWSSDDLTTYALAWRSWAAQVFDDEATWMAYLQRCPPAPPEWDWAVRANLPSDEPT